MNWLYRTNNNTVSILQVSKIASASSKIPPSSFLNSPQSNENKKKIMMFNLFFNNRKV